MIVAQAKAAARRWVQEEASQLPGFRGAFFHGSTNWLPDDDVLPATSDLDVMVVLDDVEAATRRGKFLYRNVLIEVSYLPGDQLQSPQMILGQYHLAGSFRAPGVILDPSGWLTELQRAVARDYAKREWVVRRCEHARNKVLTGFSLNAADPFHDQVVAWLFPAGILCHVLLVAGLKNPTVRRRYPDTRALLAEYGFIDLYQTLLAILGCARMSPARAKHHLNALADQFDVAKTMIRSPFVFAADISDLARPIAIDGSRDLIAAGDHREAIFWMVATASRCQKVLDQDGSPELRARFDPGYRDLLGDLGIGGYDDLQRRIGQVRTSLPQIWEVANAIMAANSQIDD